MTAATVTFEDVEPPDVEIGDDAAAAVEHLREQLVALHVELANISQAPLTLVELKERARQQIDKMAASAAPRIKVERGEFSMSFGSTDAFVPGTPANEVAAILAWLHRDAMIAAIEQQIDAMPIKGSVSADERVQRAADIQLELLRIERMEEAAIVIAAERGIEIERRETASPWAVLGITIADVAAQAA